MIRTIFTAIALSVALFTAGFAEEGKHDGDDNKVTIESLPDAVKAAVTAGAEGATIKKIKKVEKEGKVLYKVSSEKDGKTSNQWYDDTGAKVEKPEAKPDAKPDAKQD
jgi:hypothetical protein